MALFRGLQAPGMHGMKIDTCVGKTLIHTQFLKQANLKGHSKRKRTENGQSQRRVSPTCPHQGTKSAISHSPTDQNADTALYCGYKEHSYFTSTLPPPSETQGSTFLSQFSRTRIPGSKLTVNPKTTAVEESRPKYCPGSTSGLLPSSSLSSPWVPTHSQCTQAAPATPAENKGLHNSLTLEYYFLVS